MEQQCFLLDVQAMEVSANLIIWLWGNHRVKQWKKLVRWFRFWCVVAFQEDGEQSRVVGWGQRVVVGAWFWIWILGWTSVACASSQCYNWRMVDWWWIWRSVANIDESCYWSVFNPGKGERSTQLPQGFLCKKVAIAISMFTWCATVGLRPSVLKFVFM